MWRDPVEIVFGEQKFSIRPLTLDQVERLEDVLAHASIFGGKEPDGTPPVRPMQAARSVIRVGLSRDYAEVDVNALEGDIKSFAAAQAAVLRQGGFMPDLPGEEKAAAENASTGETSGESSAQRSGNRRGK